MRMIGEYQPTVMQKRKQAKVEEKRREKEASEIILFENLWTIIGMVVIIGAGVLSMIIDSL